jgi:hypothetical protein
MTTILHNFRAYHNTVMIPCNLSTRDAEHETRRADNQP